MSARTACNASRLLWMSLMIAFTPGLVREPWAGRPANRSTQPIRRSGPKWLEDEYLRSVLSCRKQCQGTGGTGLASPTVPSSPSRFSGTISVSYVLVGTFYTRLRPRERRGTLTIPRNAPRRRYIRPLTTQARRTIVAARSRSPRRMRGMQLIAPDLFTEVSRLSWGACTIGVVMGVLVWLTGWWQHRFWIVAGLTAAAGIVGLQSGRSSGAQPLAAGLLAALAAGFLAMELARLLAFFGGGTVCGLLVQAFVPTLYEPLLTFLAGGLLAALMFRLWMIVLTSLIGALLMTYAGLALAGIALKVDGAALVAQKAGML